MEIGARASWEVGKIHNPINSDKIIYIITRKVY